MRLFARASSLRDEFVLRVWASTSTLASEMALSDSARSRSVALLPRALKRATAATSEMPFALRNNSLVIESEASSVAIARITSSFKP